MTPNKGGKKYAIKDKKDINVYSQAISMINIARGCIGILSAPETDLVANQVELVW